MVNSDSETSNAESLSLETPNSEEPAQLSIKELNKKEFKTDILNNQSINQSYNKTDEKIPTKASPKEDGWIDRTAEYRSLIMKNIEYAYLVDKYDCERIDEIVEVILDAVCTRKKYIRVDGDEKSAELVKSRLLKLGPFHIDYAFDCLRKNTTKVYNIKAYLLTTLYNASATMGHYYSAEVNHDLYGS